MQLNELKDKIKAHLAAGYPGLYIQSGEDARVDAMLGDIAQQVSLHPKEWNLGYGWVDFFNKQPRGTQEGTTELANSLPELLDEDLDGKLFVIKDARSALENQPLAVARLKQLLNRIQRHHRGKAAVVLVSETLHIPPQIEAQITLLPLPLPRGEEISLQLREVCQQLALRVPQTLQQRLQAACSGLSQEEIRTALAMVRQRHEQIDDAALALIQHEKEQIIAKSGVLEMIKVSESADDVGGLENLKDWLDRRAQIFRHLAEARDARISAPKGVLIAGMPGCGKSLTAKAAAGLFQLPLLRLDIGSLLGKYVGESEHNMRRALTMAESVSPCILWIDELEKAFVGMSSGSGSEVSSRLFGYFLTWMQEKTGAVFVIATANNISALPAELLRKGRFDEVFYVGFPNAVERGAILDIHLKNDDLAITVEQRGNLIARCRDYAGADIQNAINEARETAFLAQRKMTLEDLESAIKETVPLRQTLREQVGKYEELFEQLKLKPASVADGLSVAQMIKLASDPNANRRETVASNADCPDDLLARLAGDDSLSIRMAVYQNPNCPERLLSERINILESNEDFNLDLLHLACIHTNAPHDLLASQFARLKLKPQHRHQLARISSHEPLHQCLLNDEDPAVRRALASNRNLNRETQHRLTKDASTAVRESLARNDSLGLEVQKHLSGDAFFGVREALASLGALAESVQLDLTRDTDEDVRVALARRQRAAPLPKAVQSELARDRMDVRQALAGNESLDAAMQLRLAQDPQAEVRMALAHNAALGDDIIKLLAEDDEAVQKKLADSDHLGSTGWHLVLSQSKSEAVRKALAGNRHLDAEAQTRLAVDGSTKVREALAGNANATPEVVETLMRDKDDDVRERLLHWGRQVVPPGVQRHLAKDANAGIRAYLAASSNLAEDVQTLLANDNAEVQQKLAGNASIDATTQQRLLDRGNIATRRDLARNPSLTGLVQARLADDDNVDIRCALAGNPALAAPVAEKLLGDAEQVRQGLARNHGLSETQYQRLFKSGSEDVQEILAGNPKIGQTLMTQIHLAPLGPTGAEPRPKLALASNPGLSESLQLALATKNNPSIALLQALARNPSLSLTVQEILAVHKDTEVRISLANNGDINAAIERRLLDDPAASVRTALLRGSWRNAEMELKLAQDREFAVRVALAGADHLQKATQLILANDPEKEVRVCLLDREAYTMFKLHRIAQNILVQDSDPEIRHLLARYPRLDPSVQELLASDNAVSIRKALAGSQGDWFATPLSEEVQLRLARDPDTDVRMALAASRGLSPACQAQLAADPEYRVRERLLEETGMTNPLSLKAQQVLVRDHNSDIRASLAINLFSMLSSPSSEAILLELIDDTDDDVRSAIVAAIAMSGGNKTYSAAVIAKLLLVFPDEIGEAE